MKSFFSLREQQLQEKLSVADGIAKWISDFKDSDAPQFQGKSDDERKKMAIAAYMDAKRREGGKSTNESLEEAKSKASDALRAYAKKSGGIDKKDFTTLAGKLDNFAGSGNPGAVADVAKMLRGMDTDPRDKAIEIMKKNDPAMARSVMRKAGIKEEVELEENANVDYKASSEKSQFGGYRAKLVNPQGKTSYLGGTAYKTAKAAEGEAAAYRDGYFGGPGKANERGAERMVQSYRKKNEKDLYKKESVTEGNMGRDDKSRATNDANRLDRIKLLKKHKFANPKPTKKEEIEEAVRDKKSYEAGKKAALAGKKYSENPMPSGSQAYLDWSKGHNSARARKMGMREQDEPASPDEMSMAMDQAKFIVYVGNEIMEYLEGQKEFPEWMQNKLSGLHEKAKDMHATMAGKYDESVNEGLEVKLRGGKVPVGQHRFKYDVDKSDKYIENSIKARDKDAKVERKGKDLWVTASAQAHSSVIAGLRQFRVDGTISESVELDEARRDAPKGDKNTSAQNPIVVVYDDLGIKGRAGISGNMNLKTFMSIHGISAKHQSTLAKLVTKMGKGKKVEVPANMLDDHKKEYEDEGKRVPRIWIELNSVKEGTNKPPFSGPYKKTSKDVTDKSGAKHTPLSRVRHLARLARDKKVK